MDRLKISAIVVRRADTIRTLSWRSFATRDVEDRQEQAASAGASERANESARELSRSRGRVLAAVVIVVADHRNHR